LPAPPEALSPPSGEAVAVSGASLVAAEASLEPGAGGGAAGGALVAAAGVPLKPDAEGGAAFGAFVVAAGVPLKPGTGVAFGTLAAAAGTFPVLEPNPT
jgi:hypothetical protein